MPSLHGPVPPHHLVRAFRDRFGLTPAELATLLGVDARVITAAEANGAGPPWLRYALAGLAQERFGVVPSFLLNGNPPR